jgi:hypothetical protein
VLAVLTRAPQHAEAVRACCPAASDAHGGWRDATTAALETGEINDALT